MLKKTKSPKNEKIESIKAEMNNTLMECVTRKEKYEEFLKYSLKCTNYSINNKAILFAHLENPVVKTQKQWKDMGVNVIKTDNPVYLLRPSNYEGFYKDGKWIPLRKATQEEKDAIKAGELKVYKGFNFSWFKVFDIQDTDASEEKILESQDSKKQKFQLQYILDKNGLTFVELTERIKEKIREKSKKFSFKDTYEASVMYCCGLLMGFNSMVNDFNLFTMADVNDTKKFTGIKKMLDAVIKDSESIVESFS